MPEPQDARLDRGVQGLGLSRGPCFEPVPAAPRSSARPPPGAGTACSERAPSPRAAPLPRAPAPASPSAASGSARGGRTSTRWKAASPLMPALAFGLSGSRPLNVHHSKARRKTTPPTRQVPPTPTFEASSSAPQGRLGCLSRPGLTFSCSFLEAEIFDFFCGDEMERGRSRERGAQVGVGSGRGLRTRPLKPGPDLSPPPIPAFGVREATPLNPIHQSKPLTLGRPRPPPPTQPRFPRATELRP